ncbi:hypothetical protein BH11BAC2_BH11BAC2_14830 [soil metagenome]
MITRIVRLTLQEDKISEFKKHFESSYEKIRHFEGCLFLSLYEDVDAPHVLITFSKWDSTESLEIYRKSEVFKSTWNKVKPLFKDAATAFSMQEIRN